MQLTLEKLSKQVGPTPYLYPLDLTLVPGAVTVLLGATQAGKTSLMRLMAGLDAAHGVLRLARLVGVADGAGLPQVGVVAPPCARGQQPLVEVHVVLEELLGRVLDALVRVCEGNATRAAKRLGLGPTQLDELARNAALRTEQLKN